MVVKSQVLSRLEQETYRALASRSPEGSFISPFLIALVAASTDMLASFPKFSLLLVAMAFSSGLLRHLFALRMLRSPELVGVQGFRVFTGALGGIWGLLTSFTLWQYGHDWSALFTLLVMCGVAAGGMTSLSPDMISLRIFLRSVLLAPMAVSMLTGSFALTSVILLFLLFLESQGRKQQGWLLAALEAQQKLETQAEDLTKAKLEAEKVADLKATFLASMSHEIRTPLNGIMGMTEVLLDGDLDPEQEQRALTIKRSGESLLNALNNVLDFSKLEAEMMEFETVSFDLLSVVEEVTGLFSYPAAEKGLTLDLLWDNKLPKQVRGDLTRLRQVLLNLLSNAVKFTVEGRVTLAVDKESGDSIRFTISDTGMGIPEDRFHRLFQPFTQIDSSISREFGGTGLGLAICRRLVEAMHGRMGFSSKEGKGSNFWFELALPAAESRGDSSLRRAQASVLIVDDSPVNRLIMGRLLTRCGCSWEVAESGRQALELIAERPYHLVLMDCQMAGMNGLAATQEIRKRHTQVELPIIAVTASATNELRQQCLDAGMNDFVAKPVRPEVLSDLLDRYLP